MKILTGFFFGKYFGQLQGSNERKSATEVVPFLFIEEGLVCVCVCFFLNFVIIFFIWCLAGTLH